MKLLQDAFLAQNSLYQFKNERELVESIKQLSLSFTSERESINQYGLNQKLVSAYTRFFLPSNIPKLEFLLAQVPELRQLLLRGNILDIGCGPGTYILALGELLGEDFTHHLYGVDQSTLMLEQAEKLKEGLVAKNSLSFSTRLVESNIETLLFGHSLNEMGAEQAMKLILKYQPNTLVFIEPGTPESFKEVLSCRKKLMACDYLPLYPCGGRAEACAYEHTEKDWCHQVLRIDLESAHERLGQMAGLKRHIATGVFHIYSKGPDASADPHRYRILRSFLKDKGVLKFEVCDSHHQLKKVEVLKRGLSKKELKDEAKYYPGRELYLELETTPLKNGVYRAHFKSGDKSST